MIGNPFLIGLKCMINAKKEVIKSTPWQIVVNTITRNYAPLILFDLRNSYSIANKPSLGFLIELLIIVKYFLY